MGLKLIMVEIPKGARIVEIVCEKGGVRYNIVKADGTPKTVKA